MVVARCKVLRDARLVLVVVLVVVAVLEVLVVACRRPTVVCELLACLGALSGVLEAASGVLDADVLAVVDAAYAGAPPLTIKPSTSMERISLIILNGHANHSFHHTNFCPACEVSPTPYPVYKKFLTLYQIVLYYLMSEVRWSSYYELRLNLAQVAATETDAAIARPTKRGRSYHHQVLRRLMNIHKKGDAMRSMPMMSKLQA